MQACEAIVAWSDSPISLISFATLICQDDEKIWNLKPGRNLQCWGVIRNRNRPLTVIVVHLLDKIEEKKNPALQWSWTIYKQQICKRIDNSRALFQGRKKVPCPSPSIGPFCFGILEEKNRTSNGKTCLGFYLLNI